MEDYIRVVLGSMKGSIKRLVYVIACLSSLGIAGCSNSESNHAVARDSSISPVESASQKALRWREQLGLEVLPLESGWWGFIGKSALNVAVPEGESVPAYNAIYYLLDEERPINYWHWLASDDTHVSVDGGPVEYILVSPDGVVTRHILGKDVAAGQQLTVTSQANGYKAVRLVDPKGFALMASVVTPAWAPNRVRVEAPKLDFSQRSEWLTQALMDSLTSPDAQAIAE